jgi:uncharacterized phiE125 gp8 family phage protein
MQQTWELVLPGFVGENSLELPGWTRSHFSLQEPIKLPRGHLATLDDDEPAVESVKYLDMNGDLQTLATSEYLIDNVSVPGLIMPAYGKSWPSTRDQFNAVRVTYVVGWAGTEDDPVPAPLKQALLLLVAQLYENRIPEVTGTIVSALGFGWQALVRPYRLNEVG